MWNAERYEITGTGPYTPTTGNFGWRNTTHVPAEGVIDLWTSCRETFLNTSLVVGEFYYQHGLPRPGRGRAIAVFIGKIEDKLKLKGEDRSTFQATSKRMIVKITPGKFWKSGDQLTITARMSLFSALLRCARQYRINADNFEEALWSEAYTQRTKRAVLRFLRGNTKFVQENIGGWHPGFNGWQTVFGEWEGHKVLISKMLVSPGKKKAAAKKSAKTAAKKSAKKTAKKAAAKKSAKKAA